VRRLLALPAFAASVLLLVVTLAGRLSWRAWPLGLMSNFPVQLLALAMVLLVVAAGLRARVTLVIAGASVLVNGAVIVQTLATDAPPVAAGPRLEIGHLNAQTRSIDVDALGRFILTERPDVFVVLDPDQPDVPALTRAAPGYAVRRVGPWGMPDPGYVRTVVFSRAPLRTVDQPSDHDVGNGAVEFTVDLGGAPIAVLVLGTVSPTTPGRAGDRDRALDAAARWSRRHGPRRVVMGDLNATPWSPAFRALLDDGRLESSLDGFGIQVTWPSDNQLMSIPIDHALLGPGLATADRRTGSSFGSEHRSLLVTLGAAPG
jgi:endonuclease/exonuclease/phosphatase (EEP) superfamily protein YafD